MTDPNYCPLCKCSTSFEISADNNHKLVKCEDCKEFIISCNAEEELIKMVIKKTSLVEELKTLNNNETLHIFMKNNNIETTIVDKSFWSKSMQKV